MLRKNLKLLATMVGLVAVLVGLMAMPGITQEFELPSPWTPPFNPFNPKALPDALQQNPLSRSAVVQGIDSALAALTAAEGDIWDTQCTQFYSTPRSITLAFVPLHPSSRSLQMLLAKDARNVTLEALYIPEDIPGFLRAGTYLVKIEDPNVNPAKILIVDQEGNIVYTTTAKVERSNTPKPDLYKPCFPATVQLSIANDKIRIVEKRYLWCLIKITEIEYEW